MSNIRLLTYILIMAGTTYLIRMLPLAVFRKKIKNRFIQSFLYYIPYAVLCAMTIPGIFGSTASPVSALTGLLTAILLAYFERSLIVVAMSACAVAFLTEAAMQLH